MPSTKVGMEVRQTGGLKEFRYTKTDIERILSEDTESTKAFKKQLKLFYLHCEQKNIPPETVIISTPEAIFKKPKKKMGVCEYHLCKKKTEVHSCVYCGKYFCKENLYAKPAGMPIFSSTKPLDKLFMEEWHKQGGHPCVPYYDYWMANLKRRDEAYGHALDKLLAHDKPLKLPRLQSEPYEENKIEDYEEPEIKMKESFDWKPVKIFITFLILLLLFGYLLFSKGYLSFLGF